MSTSVPLTLSARLIFISTAFGSFGAGQTGLPVRISPPCRALWKAGLAGCYSPPTPACSMPTSSLWTCAWNRSANWCTRTSSPAGQFSREAERDLLHIRHVCRGDASISQAATSGGSCGAIRTDAGNRWALAPPFDRRSTSFKARTGVGVRADGKVIFVISEEAVSFDAFARLFRLLKLGQPAAGRRTAFLQPRTATIHL
jgi:hypothetical protein